VTDAERAALRAAMRLDLPAFPCLASKAPACPGGFKAATLPTAGLATLWARHPGPLIGVPTGAASYDVLDIDRGKGGGEWYAANRDRLPATRAHRTRSGGLHLCFRHLEGVRNSTSKIANGVDVRGDGGYIIYWPAQGLKVREAELQEWPEWLLPALMPPPVPPPPRPANRPATLPAIEGLVRTVATAPPGQRNAITYWAAHRMREAVADGKIGAGLARDILLEAAGRAGLPPREASLTINSALRGGGHG
jgi:hypothetical protein